MGFLSPPSVPDPIKTAEKAGAINTQAARDTLALNTQDRFGPFGGSTTFTRDEEGVPTAQTAAFSDPLQQTSQQTQGALADLTRFLPQDQFQLSDVPSGLDLSQNFFDQQQALLAPGRAREDTALELRGAERGLPLGSEPRAGLFAPNLEARAFADAQIAGQAVSLTPQEQQRQISNQLLERSTPITEATNASNLLGGLPAPSFAPQATQQIAPVDFAGIQQQAFANEQAQHQALISGLGQAAAGLATFGTAPIFGAGLGAAAGAVGQAAAPAVASRAPSLAGRFFNSFS